jgi:acyl-CoA synthetase (AMP-forming)/AMP-acid ligase II
VLILTTGTTGEQKGARHEWSRLAEAAHADDEPGRRWLLAYNLNQFAGVQILIHVLVSRATLAAPPTSQARDAIETMRSSAVTHVSATPTFWRLLVGSLDPRAAAELPLEQITLGGEAAPGPLIDRLAELFPEARITHIYAGTEFGTVMSASDRRAGFPLSVLDRPEDAASQLRIVDGELQMRSRVGMLGYHEDEDSIGEWRPTGDLVEVREERIYFVGRKTDIINVGGAKVHPLPIEDLVSAVDGVALVAVYGRPNPVTGQIVALDVVAEPGADAEQLEAEIRRACEALPRPGRPRKIQFVEELEVRGSKVVRARAEVDA